MARLRPDTSETPMVWAPCPICWGQRRIVCRPEGRAYELVTCFGCLGVGEVLQPARETPAPRARLVPGSGARRLPDPGG
jgi:hypothetical protein